MNPLTFSIGTEGRNHMCVDKYWQQRYTKAFTMLFFFFNLEDIPKTKKSYDSSIKVKGDLALFEQVSITTKKKKKSLDNYIKF